MNLFYVLLLGFVAGIAYGLNTPLAMGCIQIIVITSGIYTSHHFISDNFKNRVPYLPGIILILLGLIRLW